MPGISEIHIHRPVHRSQAPHTGGGPGTRYPLLESRLAPRQHPITTHRSAGNMGVKWGMWAYAWHRCWVNMPHKCPKIKKNAQLVASSAPKDPGPWATGAWDEVCGGTPPCIPCPRPPTPCNPENRNFPQLGHQVYKSYFHMGSISHMPIFTDVKYA